MRGDSEEAAQWTVPHGLRRLGQAAVRVDGMDEYHGTSIVRAVLDGREGRTARPRSKTGPAPVQPAKRKVEPALRGRTQRQTDPTGARRFPQRSRRVLRDGGPGRQSHLVRFAIFDITTDSARFEQAYREDGVRSWKPTGWPWIRGSKGDGP